MKDTTESPYGMPMPAWFINKEGEIRWVCKFLDCDIQYDSIKTHLVVSMENSLNPPSKSRCKIEEVETKNFFHSERDCQIEIIRRERFEKKGK